MLLKPERLLSTRLISAYKDENTCTLGWKASDTDILKNSTEVLQETITWPRNCITGHLSNGTEIDIETSHDHINCSTIYNSLEKKRNKTTFIAE